VGGARRVRERATSRGEWARRPEPAQRVRERATSQGEWARRREPAQRVRERATFLLRSAGHLNRRRLPALIILDLRSLTAAPRGPAVMAFVTRVDTKVGPMSHPYPVAGSILMPLVVSEAEC
jgi:hypothetical protein